MVSDKGATLQPQARNAEFGRIVDVVFVDAVPEAHVQFDAILHKRADIVVLGGQGVCVPGADAAIRETVVYNPKFLAVFEVDTPLVCRPGRAHDIVVVERRPPEIGEVKHVMVARDAALVDPQMIDFDAGVAVRKVGVLKHVEIQPAARRDIRPEVPARVAVGTLLAGMHRPTGTCQADEIGDVQRGRGDITPAWEPDRTAPMVGIHSRSGRRDRRLNGRRLVSRVAGGSIVGHVEVAEGVADVGSIPFRR